MTTVIDSPKTDNLAPVDSRFDDTNLATIRNQSGASIDDDDADTNEELDDEPLDEDGDPTGEHDHHQDDNYALGGHVTRSGS